MLPWEPPKGEPLPSTYIRSLLVTRDGALWLGTAEGLARWKEDKLTTCPALAGRAVDALVEDHESTVWAGGQAAPAARLCAIHGASVHYYGDDGRFGQHVTSLYEDRVRNLWVGGLTGLWRWKPDTPKAYAVPSSVDGVQGLMENDGRLLIAMGSGIKELVDGRVEPRAFPADETQFTIRNLLRDRDGGLWIGTKNLGLVHVHQGRRTSFPNLTVFFGQFH